MSLFSPKKTISKKRSQRCVVTSTLPKVKFKLPKLLEAYIRKQAPEEYLDRVIPKFCKRTPKY